MLSLWNDLKNCCNKRPADCGNKLAVSCFCIPCAFSKFCLTNTNCLQLLAVEKGQRLWGFSVWTINWFSDRNCAGEHRSLVRCVAPDWWAPAVQVSLPGWNFEFHCGVLTNNTRLCKGAVSPEKFVFWKWVECFWLLSHTAGFCFAATVSLNMNYVSTTPSKSEILDDLLLMMSFYFAFVTPELNLTLLCRLQYSDYLFYCFWFWTYISVLSVGVS